MRSTICLFLAFLSILAMLVSLTVISQHYLWLGLAFGIANAFAAAWNLTEFIKSLK